MKTVTKYIADDGKEFTSQEECKNYEKNKWFVDLWDGTEENDFADGYTYTGDTYAGSEVLEFLLKHYIITKKLEAPSAKKVLNKGKNN
jgi:hypothetical protein